MSCPPMKAWHFCEWNTQTGNQAWQISDQIKMPAKSKTGFYVVNSEKSLPNKLKEIMSSNYMSNMKSLFRWWFQGQKAETHLQMICRMLQRSGLFLGHWKCRIMYMRIFSLDRTAYYSLSVHTNVHKSFQQDASLTFMFQYLACIFFDSSTYSCTWPLPRHWNI